MFKPEILASMSPNLQKISPLWGLTRPKTALIIVEYANVAQNWHIWTLARLWQLITYNVKIKHVDGNIKVYIF